MWRPVQRPHPQGMGDNADYSKGKIWRNRATPDILRRATLGVDQPNHARKTKRRAAAGVQSARIHPAAQNGAPFINDRGPGVRRERLSFLQSLQENYRSQIYRLCRAGAAGGRKDAAAESEPPNQRDRLRRRFSITHAVQPHVQTRLWPIANRISRAPRHAQSAG